MSEDTIPLPSDRASLAIMAHVSKTLDLLENILLHEQLLTHRKILQLSSIKFLRDL